MLVTSKEPSYFSILTNKTTSDIGGTEQLSLGVQYANRENDIARENFL